MQMLLFKSILILSCLVLVGCETAESSREKRIARSLHIFQRYPGQTQESLRSGEVQVGFDEDMVYFAMGSPHFIIKKKGEAGDTILWQYFHNAQHRTFDHEYVPGQRLNQDGTVYDLLEWDVVMKTEHEQQLRMEVEFSAGKVVSVNTF